MRRSRFSSFRVRRGEEIDREGLCDLPCVNRVGEGKGKEKGKEELGRLYVLYLPT